MVANSAEGSMRNLPMARPWMHMHGSRPTPALPLDGPLSFPRQSALCLRSFTLLFFHSSPLHFHAFFSSSAPILLLIPSLPAASGTAPPFLTSSTPRPSNQAEKHTHPPAPRDRHCLRLGVIVRIKSGCRICLDSPKQEQAHETRTTSQSLSSSFSVSISPENKIRSWPPFLTSNSACASRRANCPHLHLPLCYQARRSLWRHRVPSALLCRHPHLCLFSCRGLHGHVLGRPLGSDRPQACAFTTIALNGTAC